MSYVDLVLVVNTTQLTLYTPNWLEGITKPLPPGVILSMSVGNKDALSALINDWLAELKQPVAQVLLVVSEGLYFEKNLTASLDQVVDAQSFANIVPFERVAYKVYDVAGQKLAIGIDRDFFDIFHQSLKQHHLPVAAVIPLVVLLELIGTPDLSPAAVKILFKKTPNFRDYSLIVTGEEPRSLQEQEQHFSEEHSRLVILIFIIFLAVLMIVTWYILR